VNVGIGPLRTGIFNVADIAVMLGAFFVLWASYRFDSTRELSRFQSTLIRVSSGSEVPCMRCRIDGESDDE
jgi:hypothetical protein